MLGQDSVHCGCKDHERATFDRPVLFIPLILVMMVSLIFIFAYADDPFGIQLASIIPYTAFVVLATFSAQHGQQPYFFECPFVRRTLPRLERRHAGFLGALVVFETLALQLRANLPQSWIVAGKDGSPFGITLFISGTCFAVIQIWTNRSILERAHAEEQTSS